MTVNANFDQILATTLAKHRPELTDNVFKATVLADRLQRSGNVRVVDGGTKIVEPLIYAENDTVMTYEKWDRLDLTPQTGISAAEYNWKQFAGAVAINGYEEAVNSGTEALINLVTAKVTQLEKSLAAVLNRNLHGDYTGVDSSKAMSNIATAIDDTAVFGNINPATSGNEFWKSTVIDAEAEDAVDNAKWTNHRWGNAFYQASAGLEAPKFGLTTVELYQMYEESLIAQLRYTSNDAADSRFQNLAFKGIPMYFDISTTTGNTYFINEDNFSLVTHKDRWMKSLGFRDTPDVDGKWSLIVSMGQLTCRERRGSAKVINQTLVDHDA